MRKGSLSAIVSIIAVFLFVVLLLFGCSSFLPVSELFKLNGELKSEGYYMAEFEFKMLGCAYYLDKGHYLTALTRLNELHGQLKSREGLTRIPRFADKKDELEFFLGLQNPKTGAFMDDSYPLFTYIGPTLNVLDHLTLLSREVGAPLRLKYPLRFLDDINTPEKLTAFLDDLCTVGWIGARFRTPFVEAGELLSCPQDMERTGLYAFSPEWKEALLQWFYNNQDKETGFWGVRLRRSGRLLNSGDLVTTEKIIKLFVDEKGADLHARFPLRYREKMFATTLRKLAEPIPANLEDAHDWTLAVNRGTKVLTKYLWSGASTEDKENTRKLLERILRDKFEKFYCKKDGAFSLYPHSRHADLDGTGEMLGFLDHIGALSGEKQRLVWGWTDEKMTDLGTIEVSALSEGDFASITAAHSINSVRLYRTDPGPEDYMSDVVCLYYPKKTTVPDIMELLPGLIQWINTTPQIMGNWVSKENILRDERKDLTGVKMAPVPVLTGKMPLKPVIKTPEKGGRMIAIGFDVLQIPRYKMTLLMK